MHFFSKAAASSKKPAKLTVPAHYVHLQRMRIATLTASFSLGFRGTIRGGSFITWHKQRQALLLSIVIASAIPIMAETVVAI